VLIVPEAPMSSSVPSAQPRLVLADRLPGTLVRDVVLVLGFALAIALGAQVALPLGFTPVPVTAQTFVVLAGAAALGARRAAAGALAFAAFGVVGVPWFAVTGGATLGYIAGFVLAALLVGSAAEAGLTVRPIATLGVMLAASAVIYAFGATVLALVLGIGAGQAIALGVAPFVLGDLIKVVAAAMLVPSLERALR
jgi:biotin transport system substrate-specific component